MTAGGGAPQLAIPFEKWHGLGNDFVVVRESDLAVSALTPNTVIRWCDRHRGIGADGVLVLAREDGLGFEMRVHNADGSTPEICGNGVRCAVRSWAARRQIGQGEAQVVTGAGKRHCTLSPDGTVAVEMGPARWTAPHLPQSSSQATTPTALDVEIGGLRRQAYPVSMGNPHLVLFGEVDDWTELPDRQANALERDPRFSERTNVSFARATDERHVVLRVWERGVGFTQACGSAACATAAVGVAVGICAADTELSVTLPGGTLFIRVSTDASSVRMRGPAVEIFRGAI